MAGFPRLGNRCVLFCARSRTHMCVCFLLVDLNCNLSNNLSFAQHCMKQASKQKKQEVQEILPSIGWTHSCTFYCSVRFKRGSVGHSETAHARWFIFAANESFLASRVKRKRFQHKPHMGRSSSKWCTTPSNRSAFPTKA